MLWFTAVIICLSVTTIARDEECASGEGGWSLHAQTNITQMISHDGYPSEEYEVLTDDGYYLTINRIPGGKNLTIKGPKPVVFLQHGFMTYARFWILNLPDKSLGYILANAGYDVWLGNSRGTRWSQKHQNFSTDHKEFWDFSFHEIAVYDLPAMINFILQKTGQKQLFYVGHSQGATVGFIAFSTIPELSQKVKMFFALSPAMSIKHVQTPAIRLLSSLPENILKVLLGNKYFLLTHGPVKELINKLCSIGFMQRLCLYAIFSTGGINETNFDMSKANDYIDTFPEESSIKSILHWKQTGQSGSIQYFDYRSENLAKYNQLSPPAYKIEDMTVPTAVWSGGNDSLANPEDTKNLLPRISSLVYYHCFPDWNHWDFLWGLNAPERLYYKIIELMETRLGK